jgi:hypothetical protein
LSSELEEKLKAAEDEAFSLAAELRSKGETSSCIFADEAGCLVAGQFPTILGCVN